ncbi:cellulose synthase A catalytic subunit 8 [UDP-forming] [Tanacetum coccineum]
MEILPVSTSNSTAVEAAGETTWLSSNIASTHRPGLIASSNEDGRVCWFDMRSKDVLYTMDVAQNPISSLCFKEGNADILYVSSEYEVNFFDVHMLASWYMETNGELQLQ